MKTQEDIKSALDAFNAHAWENSAGWVETNFCVSQDNFDTIINVLATSSIENAEMRILCERLYDCLDTVIKDIIGYPHETDEAYMAIAAYNIYKGKYS